MKKLLAVTFTVLMASLTVACGGGGTKAQPDAGTDVPGLDIPGDNSIVGPDVPYGVKTLKFVIETDDIGQSCVNKTTCNIVLPYSGDRSLEVAYFNGSEPIAGAVITYEILGDTSSICQLEASSTFTNAQGIAATKVRNILAQPGQLQVKVCADGEADVSCLYFNVVVSPKNVIPLVVGFEDYVGMYPQMNTARVLIFKQDAATKKPKCADLNMDALPTATASVGPIALTQTAAFPSLPKLGSGAGQEPSQMYTIIGMANMNNTGAVRAYACNDSEGLVEVNKSRFVELTLADLTPKLAGTYEVWTTIDFVSGLPPTVATVINYITDLFQSPTATLIKAICQLSGDSLQGVCDAIFVQPGTSPCPASESFPSIEDNCMTALGIIVKDVLDAVITALIASNDTAAAIFFTGQDVSVILTKFQLGSQIKIAQEPNANGETTLEQKFNTIKVRWTLGVDCDPMDPECGWNAFSLASTNASGVVQATGVPCALTLDNKVYKLSIDPHAIQLKYGVLARWILETFVFPRIWGPDVDSVQKMMAVLLGGSPERELEENPDDPLNCVEIGIKASHGEYDPTKGYEYDEANGKFCIDYVGCCCASLTQKIVGEGGTGNNALVSACNALIPALATLINTQLESLDVSSGENFQLATKAPCPLGDKLESNGMSDMLFDSMGTMAQPCEWSAVLTFKAGSYAPKATFYGTRK